ncbi:MoxR family ATPase [Salinadaptatus halalkaliphilus]|uniref:MoxR family ATPase n=1 Tax=Salinadaptatus halalkaliphilus TaxID=2419781 RepID=A0A4S3TM77_9EURY|nr:MoxR family ATPase [Salinadaptatus halalkaliphilus]THE65309.1 MoxR family ATPase [Salinadaptatus halalkaliphilus]
MDEPTVAPAEAADAVEHIVDRVEDAAIVDDDVLQAIVAAVLARGHVLLEDVPGTGKTVTARVLAEAMGLEFTRIQFTPDLLPADVTGSMVYDEHAGEFAFAEGPVFTNVVLADEINRAPPKTQAALLEAMEERQVSVDGETHELPTPFIVIATQNPIEQDGTFRLPEAQRDRFSVKTSLGYPDIEGEMGLLERRATRRTLSPSVEPVVTPETVDILQAVTEGISVERDLRRYIVDLARATREDERVEIGVSPRGVQRVFEAARAGAVIDGRSYVTPIDIKRLAIPTMAHRLVLTTEATVEGVDATDVVRRALQTVDVPGVSPTSDDAHGDPASPETEPVTDPALLPEHEHADPTASADQPGRGSQASSPDDRQPTSPTDHRPSTEPRQEPATGEHQDPVSSKRQESQSRDSDPWASDASGRESEPSTREETERDR